jgi:hypothetical protein
MAKLSKLTTSSSANDAVNALKNSTDARLHVTGGKEGTVWYVMVDDKKVASGSIPQSSHNVKNLEVALQALIDAVATYQLTD